MNKCFGKMVELGAQAIEGKFHPQREKDALSVALENKEHPGHTRGLGARVPWRTGFDKKYRGMYRKRSKEERGRRQEERLLALVDIRMKQHLAAKEQVPAIMAPDPGAPSSVASTTLAVDEAARYPVDDIEEATPCKLMVTLANIKIKVAARHSYPTGAVMHTTPTPTSYERVSVDKVGFRRIR